MIGNVQMALLLSVLFGCAVAISIGADSGYTHFIITLVAISTITGVGLNVLYGLTGMISFGHIAFQAIGAYTCAILMLQDVNFFIALPVAALLTAVTGLLLALPAVRVAGPFLAMVTIAFFFVIEHGIIEWRSLTGGQNGLFGFPPVSLGDHIFTERDLSLFAILSAFISLIAYHRLSVSGWGLAMKGVRDAEIASASLGLNTVRTKIIAFGISAFFAGIAGAIYTPLIMFIAPSNFPFSQSILALFSVILGGTGATIGPLIGAFITVMLPELLANLAQYRLLFFGALMLAVLLMAPSGVAGLLGTLFKPRKIPRSDPDTRLAPDWLKNQLSAQRLEVSHLSIAFGGVKAVQDVSFTASSNQILSIIGPNGAGKTSVLNMVSGFYKPDNGTVRVGNTDIAGQPAYIASRHRIARTYQTTRLYEKMTVLENVFSGLQHGKLGSPFQALASRSSTQLAIGLLRLSGYHGDPDLLAGNLPHVDRRFVEIARALATAPGVILLDEPAAGLMRADKDQLALTLKEIASLGISVVLVEHDMTLVMGVSDNILVLDTGKPIAFGTPDAVRKDEKVLAAYLGNTDFSAPSRQTPLQTGSKNLLTVSNLKAGYGAASVLHDLSLEINEGELVAILGANGAGKSTLMSALSGLLKTDGGEISLNSKKIHNLPSHDIVGHGLVLVPEGRQVFPELTVLQNIRLGAYKRRGNVEESEVEHLLVRFPRLRDRLHSQAGLLSGGEQQMLAIARGLMAKPAVLLLDEPSLGLSPAMVTELYLILSSLRDEGVTILLVDQIATLALDIADRAYVIEQGTIVAQGSSEEIRLDKKLASAYLGSD